jgi:hypothetical protein
MTEAEVILRLAMYYIKEGLTKENVNVSIDGAHIKTGNTIHFDIFGFIKENKLEKLDDDLTRWQGEYSVAGSDCRIIITSTPGIGDVNVKLIDGKVVYAECKKGKSDKRGREYPLMREAIGQLVTGCDFGENIVPIVAISNTDKAKELAERWSKLTQIKNMGIKFALVCDEGDVKFI